MIKILKEIDKPLLIVSVLLFGIGLITIFSASNITAFMQYEAAPSRYFFKESMFILAGIIIAIILVRIPTSKYAVLSWASMFIITGLIVITTLLGQVVNGMSGWINYNGLGIQPSEFAKIGMIPLIATFYNINIKQKNNFSRMMVPLIIATIVTGTIIFQGDLGTAIIFFGLCILMFLLSPASSKIKFKVISIGIIFAAFLALILIVGGDKIIPSEKLERFNYNDPCSRYITTGNQLCNGYIAINGGGLTGKGLGNSTQKYLYLPEAHTDFIFAIFVEESGIIGAIVLFTLYFILLVRVIVIGKRSLNMGNALICYGVSFYIFMHIIVNLTGVLGILPMTGVPLPFMSYGGSICLCTILALTMVQRIAYENNKEYKKLKKS